MKCANCKAEIEDTWITCPYCGASLSSNTKITSTEKVGNGALAFLLLFLWPVGIFVMWHNKMLTKKSRVVITIIFSLIAIMDIACIAGMNEKCTIDASDVALSGYIKNQYNDFDTSMKHNISININGVVDDIQENKIVLGEFGYTIEINTNKDYSDSIHKGDLISISNASVKEYTDEHMIIDAGSESTVKKLDDAINAEKNNNYVKGYGIKIDEAKCDTAYLKDMQTDIDKQIEAEKLKQEQDNKLQEQTEEILNSAAEEVSIDELIDSYKNNDVAYKTKYENKHLILYCYIKNIHMDSTNNITLDVDNKQMSSWFGSEVEFSNIEGLADTISNMHVGDKVAINGIGDTSGAVFDMHNCISIQKIADTQENNATSGNVTSEANVESSIKITAQNLEDQFDNNQVACKTSYDGKTLQVTGIIDDIGTNIIGQEYVTFTNSKDDSITTIQCFFKNSELSDVSALVKGQSVTIQGVADVGSTEPKLGDSKVIK